ncbi:single-strand DNA-binding protein [Psychromicrobium silvestre]|uniref:Single-stranded DNA-binding protein n=1 Tax=Psychromicrobium silvestre TaxID=1645614 RepID=A0A7Y9LS15_9MICC|nr:single-stranded DNA-binding protein [Psychromicrobium silvestre]NYE94546.1 single-strand DNA-binding protein [Psychromicrobium silvestre]
MNDVVTVRGFVASEVRMTLTESGWPIATFRLGSTERRFDRVRSQWVDAGTNWYSVSMFRGLAQNASCSVSKGERVIVTGKLKLRQWTKGERHGIAPEIDADAVGHDLVWGTAKFKRASTTAELEKIAGDASAEPRALDQVETGTPEGRDASSEEPASSPQEAPAQPPEQLIFAAQAGGTQGEGTESVQDDGDARLSGEAPPSQVVKAPKPRGRSSVTRDDSSDDSEPPF